MKYLIIIIPIILLFAILIINSNIYFKESFLTREEAEALRGSYNQNTIEDIIPISFVPENPNQKIQLNDYEIIMIYKEILLRTPTLVELKSKAYLSKPQLMEELYNSHEYERNIKTQDNQAVGEMEGDIARNNVILKLTDIYKLKYGKMPPEKMITPLRYCYIYLQSNIYLFTELIHSPKYPSFENEILGEKTLNTRTLLIIFNKYYDLYELKTKAELRIKSDPNLNDATFEKLRLNLTKLDQITTSAGGSNKDLMSFLNQTSIKEKFENEEDNLDSYYEKTKVGSLFKLES